MTWSSSKKTTILPSTLMTDTVHGSLPAKRSVKCQCEKRENSPKSRWAGFIQTTQNGSVKCWFFVGAEQGETVKHFINKNTKMSRDSKAPRPKSQKIHKSPGANVSSEKKLRFSGHSCYLHPETLGKWSHFWGTDFSKGNLKSPTSFVHVFLRGNTRGKKSSSLKSVFKGDQVMAVQQQRQGPNGCGVLVAKKLVLGVM